MPAGLVEAGQTFISALIREIRGQKLASIRACPSVALAKQGPLAVKNIISHQ
jgi:hypothetical protein